MRTKMILSLILAGFAGLTVAVATRTAQAEGIGATCWAKPFTAHKTGGYNVCRTVPDTQFPGLNMIAARSLTIKKCEEENAMDYGCSEGKCCFQQCKQVANCIYGTPNIVPFEDDYEAEYGELDTEN